jgi:putative oxidoreductase
MDVLGLFGRLLMSAIFIQAGFVKATAPAATMAYFAKEGLPVVGAAYALTLAVEIGGGIVFLLGYRVRLVALVLAAWCVATGFVAHYHPGNRDAMIHFMKNICMTGGFLQVVAFGSGRLCLGGGRAPVAVVRK